MRALPLLLTVAACSYKPTFGDQPDDAQGDSVKPDASDGPIDSFVGPEPSACVQKWLAGTMTFGLVNFIEPPGAGSLTTSQDERDPFVSSDELQLYFVRNGSGDKDVLTSSRVSTAVSFTNASIKSSLSDVLEDGKVSMTGDDLTAIVASRRSGGSGGVDFWQGKRSASGTQAFPTLDQSFLAQVNNAGDQSDPHVSPDGLRLYYATGNPQTIVIAERNGLLANFGASSALPNINGSTGDADPTLTADERVMIFTSNRTGSLGLTDLWYATRAERDQPFGAPQNLTLLNTTEDDGDAHLSNDGCRVYWASRRDPSTSDYDLFFVQQN